MSQPFQVVIVEDEPIIAKLNKAYTEKDPRFQVVRVFEEGRSALRYLSETPADLMILDVYMPLLNGVELLRELRGRGIETDAIMVTAAHETHTLETLLKLGVTDYLVKPFSLSRFQQALETFCQRRLALDHPTQVTQSQIDRLLFTSTPFSDENPVPKGLQSKTLAMLRDCLKNAGPQGASSDTLSLQAGLSTVTIRRYMNYMLAQGLADSRVNYDTGGRPSVIYFSKEFP